MAAAAHQGHRVSVAGFSELRLQVISFANFDNAPQKFQLLVSLN